MSRDETVSVRAKNGTLTYDGKRVDQAKIEALVAALRAPIIPAPNPTNLGSRHHSSIDRSPIKKADSCWRWLGPLQASELYLQIR